MRPSPAAADTSCDLRPPHPQATVVLASDTTPPERASLASAPTASARKPALSPAPTHSLQRPPLWLFAPLLLYLAALNPYFPAGNYDDVIYYSGAVSLATEGSFKFEGLHISEWPPGVSVLLALPFALGLQSMWTAKLCILLCAAGGLICGWRLWQQERRPLPLLTLGLFALLPCSFIMGTRVMSEWPYFLTSILFLLALHRLRDESRLGPAVLAGLLLGAAALTKFTGVLLGAAVVAQIVSKLRHPATSTAANDAGSHARRNRARAILPELVASAIGATCFLLWKAKTHWQVHAGTAAEYEYYRGGLIPELIGRIDPLAIPGKLSDLLFHSEATLRLLGWSGSPAAMFLVALPGVVILLGLGIRLFSRERTPADWYVLSLLVLLATAGENQQTRYLMPVAPFLIAYGFGGARLLRTRFRLPATFGWNRAWQAAIGLWVVLLVGGIMQLLLRGNLSRTHGGLFYFSSPTAETFYRGYWLELHRACQLVRQDSRPGNVAVLGDDDRYVSTFTGRRRVELGSGEPFRFLLALHGVKSTPEQIERLQLETIHRSAPVTLYRRNDYATHELKRTPQSL